MVASVSLACLRSDQISLPVQAVKEAGLNGQSNSDLYYFVAVGHLGGIRQGLGARFG